VTQSFTLYKNKNKSKVEKKNKQEATKEKIT
jgi:hypothetical protein